MKYTGNYNLKKPEGTDTVNIEDFNDNADIIDSELKKLNTNKVDKVSGKGLSTNDYTDAEKNKLAGIEAGANKYVHPSTHPASMITESTTRRFTSDAEKANWDSKETPEGAQAKANAAASSALAAANSYTDQKVGALAGEGNVKTVKQLDDDLAAHKAENASQHGDLTTLKTSTKSNLVGAINELFTNVSNGKNVIATAITDMGQSASGSDTFAKLANSIRAIETGDYSIGDILDQSKYLATQEEVWKFTGHTNEVEAVAVDNNGNVYSGSGDKTVRKISSSGFQVWSFTGHTGTVYAVAVDSNGYVYSGGYDQTVRKISPSGNEIWKFTGHIGGAVRAVAVDNNGYVYSGGGDYTVRKIDSSGKQVWKFTGHTDWVTTVAVDNNGYVYSGGGDYTVRKINSSGSQLWSFTGHTSPVNAVAVDNNGNVYSGSNDKTLRKISPSGNEIWKFTGDTDTVDAVAVDNNGNVYICSGDRTVRKISPSGNEIWKITRYNNILFTVAVDNNGYVYIGSFDKAVRKILDGIKIIA